MIIYDMYDKILDHVIFFVCFNYYLVIKLKYKNSSHIGCYLRKQTNKFQKLINRPEMNCSMSISPYFYFP